MESEITMKMTVFIANRKPVNQLSGTSEKEYEGAWEGENIREENMATTCRGRGCLSQMVVIIRHHQV